MSTTFSAAMKEDSAYHISSAIPIHTSTGAKTGILDSGSGAKNEYDFNVLPKNYRLAGNAS